MDPPTGRTARQQHLVGTTIALCVMIDALVLIRLFIRKVIVKALGWDDLLVFLAVLSMNACTAINLILVHYGLGTHRSEMSDADHTTFLRYSYVDWIMTFQTLTLTKISICLLLLRFVVTKSYKWLLYTWITLLVATDVVITSMWIAQCRPTSYAWLAPATPELCLTESELGHVIFAQAIVSIASDFLLAAYPLFIIKRLRITRNRRIGLALLMSLGVFTGALCIARTALNWQNIGPDSSYTVIPNWYLRSMEVFMGFIAACAPTFYPGYRWLLNRSGLNKKRHTPRDMEAGRRGKKSRTKLTSDTPLAKALFREKKDSSPSIFSDATARDSMSSSPLATSQKGYSKHSPLNSKSSGDYLAHKGAWLQDATTQGASPPPDDAEVQHAAHPPAPQPTHQPAHAAKTQSPPQIAPLPTISPLSQVPPPSQSHPTTINRL